VFCAVAEQQERAFNLGLAGLLGDRVFNFGELVSLIFLIKTDTSTWIV